ncbi:lipopolysaccharide biosynthesis protein [Paenibacillus oenotherae]|uniref:Lipopolysaccharide biosynthesis protein n=1 Tax=Paenibacillus oenotherae TaxID=1435645 RepID=A0ABS7D9U6_9BACL|nr:Wzz/FepE/Etk N-terminal domain-containing protein [Paenibacillus oenotherae]MBW7476714.1 lipopolysaccharide biosynthesis protein [Paenibacillus oenotherae]
MELKQYWAIVRKRIWLIVLLMVVSGMLTGYYSYQSNVKLYTASAKLMVNQNASEETKTSLDVSSINMNLQLIKTYVEIIRTPRIMSKVIQEFPELDMTVNELVRKVNVTTVNGTQVMSLTVTDLKYSRAAHVVNAVAKVFQAEIPKLMKLDNIIILNEADPFNTPAPMTSRPNLNIAISLLLSFMIGLGLVFLLEYLDDSIKTEEDVKALFGVPPLSLIPRTRVSARTSGKEKQATMNVKRGESNVTLDT